MDDAGNVLPLRQMLPHVRAAISSVKVRTEVDKDGNVSQISEVRFWNKNSALENLAEHLSKWVELMEKGKAGEFDHLSCEELWADIEALEAVAKARNAVMREDQTPAPPDYAMPAFYCSKCRTLDGKGATAHRCAS